MTSTDQGPREVLFRSIGVIRTPFAEQRGTPIQPRFARDAEGVVDARNTVAARCLTRHPGDSRRHPR